MKRLLMLPLLAAGIASADMIPVLINPSSVSCAPGSAGILECKYDYSVTLHDSGMLTADQTAYPEFFTIYDFDGFTGRTDTPAGWSFNSAATGQTPSSIIANFDNGLVPNLTWTYIGSTDIAGGTTITGFSAYSIYGPAVRQGFFTSESTHNTFSPGEMWVQNIGHTDVPLPQLPSGDEAVPEPATLGLFGAALFALGVLRKKRI